MKLASLPYLIRSNFIKTTYDISLDSQISFLPLGFSPRFRDLISRGQRESKGKERKGTGNRTSFSYGRVFLRSGLVTINYESSERPRLVIGINREPLLNTAKRYEKEVEMKWKKKMRKWIPQTLDKRVHPRWLMLSCGWGIKHFLDLFFFNLISKGPRGQWSTTHNHIFDLLFGSRLFDAVVRWNQIIKDVDEWSAPVK